MIYIGIDPGKKGGYAVIGLYDEPYVMPWNDEGFVDCITLVKSRFGAASAIAAVEKVGAMPGQGVTGMFNFGKSAGFIEGVLTAFGVSYQLIPPQTWKKEYSLSGDKSKSVKTCKRLFPNVDLLPTERSRKESDGMAEALLLALYAQRHF